MVQDERIRYLYEFDSSLDLPDEVAFEESSMKSDGMMIAIVLLLGVLGVLGMCSSFLKHYIVVSSETEQDEDKETDKEKAQRKEMIDAALNETKVVSLPETDRTQETVIVLSSY